MSNITVSDVNDSSDWASSKFTKTLDFSGGRADMLEVRAGRAGRWRNEPS